MRRLPQLIQPVIQTKINVSDIGNFYFGDEANTFTEGNDLRLENSRNPNGNAGGDLTGTYPNPTLILTGITANSYGDSTHVAQITVDAKGRLSLASSVSIAFPPDYISSISDTNSIDLTISSAILSADLKKQNSTSINLSIDSSGLKAARNALIGDITASSDNNTTTLATVNGNIGVFGSATQVPIITVNGKGLITAISNTTITPAASSIAGGQALSKIDDTNIILTLGGSPTTSLLSATSLTLGWTGTLSDIRLSTTTVTAGSYGSASQIPTYTVSATGRLTAASNVAIQIAESQVTNLAADLSARAGILSTTESIDAKVIATTNLYTVPVGKKAIVTGAAIRVTSATAVTIVPVLGIGISSGEDDIFSSTSLTGVDSTGKSFFFTSIGTIIVGQATDIIKIGIDTGATATSMIISIDLIGYLI